MDVDEPPSKPARSEGISTETANLSSYDTVPTFLQGRLQAPVNKQTAGPVVPVAQRRVREKEKERDTEREVEDHWRDRINSRPVTVGRPRYIETERYIVRDRSYSPDYATRSRSRSQERVSSFRPRRRHYSPPPSIPRPRFSSSRGPIRINNRTKNRDYYSSDNSFSDEDERPVARRRERDGVYRTREKHIRHDEAERTRDTTNAPYGMPSASGPQTVLSSNRVNAVWDPSQKSDLTIHLKLPVQENLDDKIDEFCRLRRLGDFASARNFFAQELADQDDNPYVLVQYAEMLLEQCDYATLAKLNGHELFAPGGRLLDSKEGYLLCTYWHMMQVERSRYSPPMPWVSLRAIRPALIRLHDSIISTGQDPMSSTQIRMLASFLMLSTANDSAFIQPDWLRMQLLNLFPASFYRRLYTDLLREGRVWDFHDIFAAKLAADGPEEALPAFVGSTNDKTPMQTVLDDWTPPSRNPTDNLTLLALLDMVLRIDISPKTMGLANPLALAIMESPDAMGSHIFVQWMLQRMKFTLNHAKHERGGRHERLVSAPGIYLQSGYRIPAYIPVGKENPGWGNVDVPVEYRNLTKSVLGHGKRLANYNLQADALRALIMMSQDPNEAFMELCTLQKSIQGNISSYTLTVISSYLAHAPGAPSEELKKSLREICFNPADCLATEDKWLASLLLYSMESDAEDADEILSQTFHHSIYLPAQYVAEFDERMPELRLKRLEYLKNKIGDPVERRHAEYGQMAKVRERDAMDFPEFDDLDPEEYNGGYDEESEGERERVVIRIRPNERMRRGEETIRRRDSDESEYDSDISPGYRMKKETFLRRFDLHGKERSKSRWETRTTEADMKRDEERKMEMKKEEERKADMKRDEERKMEMKRDEERKLEIKRDEERVLELKRTLESIKELQMRKTQEEAEKEKRDKKEKELQEERKRALEALESMRTEELLKKKQAAVEELRREEEERRRLEILEREAREEEEKLAAERQRREEVEKRLTQRWQEAHDNLDETKSAPEPRTRGFRRPDSPSSTDSLDLPDAPDPPGSGRSSPIYKQRRRHKPSLRVKRVLVPPVIVQIDRLSPLSSPSASPPGSPRSESSDSNSSDAPSFHGAYRPRQLDPVYEEVHEEEYANDQSHHAYVEELDDSDEPTGPSPGIEQAPGVMDSKKGKSKQDRDGKSYGAGWKDLKTKEVGDQAPAAAAGETNGNSTEQSERNGKSEGASGEAHAGPSSREREN